MDENAKNSFSEPTPKQDSPEPNQQDRDSVLFSFDPIRGAASAGTMRCLTQISKQPQLQSCKVCNRNLVQEDEKYKLNSLGQAEIVCFVCFLAALKPSHAESKQKTSSTSIKGDTLQSLGLQSCTKHPSSHSLSSFSYCLSCDLVMCSNCLLTTPHRLHHIYPLTTALSMAKKLKEFIITQVHEQERTVLESVDESCQPEPNNEGDNCLMLKFEALWRQLTEALQQKEQVLRQQLLDLQAKHVEQQKETSFQKQELLVEFHRMKKEFRSLNGLELLKSTLSQPELNLERAYQSNRDSLCNKTPNKGNLTPRTNAAAAAADVDLDPEVFYQEQLKNWRSCCSLGVRSSKILQDLEACKGKAARAAKLLSAAAGKLSLGGLPSVVQALQRVSLEPWQSESSVVSPTRGGLASRYTSAASLKQGLADFEPTTNRFASTGSGNSTGLETGYQLGGPNPFLLSWLESETQGGPAPGPEVKPNRLSATSVLLLPQQTSTPGWLYSPLGLPPLAAKQPAFATDTALGAQTQQGYRFGKHQRPSSLTAGQLDRSSDRVPPKSSHFASAVPQTPAERTVKAGATVQLTSQPAEAVKREPGTKSGASRAEEKSDKAGGRRSVVAGVPRGSMLDRARELHTVQKENRSPEKRTAHKAESKQLAGKKDNSSQRMNLSKDDSPTIYKIK